jgi:8-oxo-dGTP pyrophosphatase MutT (NUDIX family)
MVAASILPVAIHKGKMFFLFGKEAPGNDTPGFSDFGGGVENDESPFETALREGAEELTGFLGNPNQLRKYIETHGGYYQITHKTYHIHIILIDYDENLPKFYNANHHFIWSKMNHEYMKKTRIFEKIEIEWFSIEHALKCRRQFRQFYREILDVLYKEKPMIMEFAHAKKQEHKNNKTRKTR